MVGIVGDYSLQFLIEELAVAAQYHIPFVMVVMNNAYLGLIRQAERGYKMDYEVQLWFQNINAPEIGDYGVDHVKAAEAFGCIARRVFDPAESARPCNGRAPAATQAACRWWWRSSPSGSPTSPWGRRSTRSPSSRRSSTAPAGARAPLSLDTV